MSAHQLDMEIPPGTVRTTDRATSLEAAAAVAPHLSALQRLVYLTLCGLGPSTDEQLRDFFEARYPGKYAESTVRKRRCDLVELGYVRDSGRVEANRRKGNMTVWEAVPGKVVQP